MNHPKKIVIAPDSFKGSLSSLEVSEIMRAAVLKHFPSCEVRCCPLADGGEGTVDCFLAFTDAKRIIVETSGPYGEPLSAYYALDGKRALLEMAQVAGLPQVLGRENPRKTTTYGLGALIKDAVMRGCREIMIGLGGSCTNDAGIGMACALGAQFLDASGKTFSPHADEMSNIRSLDIKAIRALLSGIKIIGLCDIKNPMYGKDGAAYVFAGQKGASAADMRLLDDNLRALATIFRDQLGLDVANRQGAGAAGALGAGILAFLGGELRSGIDTILDTVSFDESLDGADLVFSGEGRFDGQTLSGKAISGVAARAKKHGVPLLVVAGSAEGIPENAYQSGITAVFSSTRCPCTTEACLRNARENLAFTMDAILRLYQSKTARLEEGIR